MDTGYGVWIPGTGTGTRYIVRIYLTTTGKDHLQGFISTGMKPHRASGRSKAAASSMAHATKTKLPEPRSNFAAAVHFIIPQVVAEAGWIIDNCIMSS